MVSTICRELWTPLIKGWSGLSCDSIDKLCFTLSYFLPDLQAFSFLWPSETILEKTNPFGGHKVFLLLCPLCRGDVCCSGVFFVISLLCPLLLCVPRTRLLRDAAVWASRLSSHFKLWQEGNMESSWWVMLQSKTKRTLLPFILK